MSASSTGGSHRREGDRIIVETVSLSPVPEAMRIDTLFIRKGALEQTKRLGLICANEPCPPPRDFLLRYEKR
jgi:hypothetical protein